ncbi:MAG: acyltransferase family protein [Prevotella sp.]|nr:acyltransferase family protein [Prevotella sp.]
MEVEKRITWIDYTKGFAILLLLLSHSMTKYNLFNNWIFAFHMPIFFIICGYLVHLKYNDGFKDGQFFDLLSKRWYNIFIPYFIFGTILIIFFTVLKLVSETPSNAISMFINLITMKGIASMWFLPIYFFSEFLSISLLSLFKGKPMCYLMAFFVGVLWLVDQSTLSWPLDLLYKIAEGTVFIYIGTIFANNELESKASVKIAVILLAISSFLTIFNQKASMNNMGIVPLYFINATIISFSIITIIRQLGERQGHYQLVSFYGKNSLIIVCTNNLVIEICRLIDHKMFCNSLLHMDYIGIFIFFIIITICEYPLLKLFEGKFKRPMTIIKRT